MGKLYFVVARACWRVEFVELVVAEKGWEEGGRRKWREVGEV